MNNEKDGLQLHIGCGKRNFGDEWVHIDGENFPHIQYHDVTKLPFEDGTVSLIYAAHILEYFDREEVKGVLKEWFRVLKPGGKLRVAVPNFQAMAALYFRKGMNLKYFVGPLYGKMKMGEDYIYHKTTYDYDNLYSVMMEAGFNEMYEYDWRDYEIHRDNDDHSQSYIPHMDKENGTLISLNVEAVK